MNQPLLDKCRYFKDYSTLVGKVKQGIANGFEKDVFNMLALQWNIDDAKKAWFQDGKDEKSEEIALKMINKGKDFEEIQEFTDLPIQRIKELADSQNS